jgi:hypothetical protein
MEEINETYQCTIVNFEIFKLRSKMMMILKDVILMCD